MSVLARADKSQPRLRTDKVGLVLWLPAELVTRHTHGMSVAEK